MVKHILRGTFLGMLGVVAAASAAAGNISVNPATTTKPKISSVSTITTAQHQVITIKGSDFGSWPAYTGDSNFIQLRVFPKGKAIWEAGYWGPDHDTVTLIVKSWTNTQIVLGGFAGKWNEPGFDFTLAKGNPIRIEVWNWPKGSGPFGKVGPGPAVFNTVVK